MQILAVGLTDLVSRQIGALSGGQFNVLLVNVGM